VAASFETTYDIVIINGAAIPYYRRADVLSCVLRQLSRNESSGAECDSERHAHSMIPTDGMPVLDICTFEKAFKGVFVRYYPHADCTFSAPRRYA
jgi:hypothetical protein